MKNTSPIFTKSQKSSLIKDNLHFSSVSLVEKGESCCLEGPWTGIALLEKSQKDKSFHSSWDQKLYIHHERRLKG